jgi:hypothetical protein
MSGIQVKNTTLLSFNRHPITLEFYLRYGFLQLPPEMPAEAV